MSYDGPNNTYLISYANTNGIFFYKFGQTQIGLTRFYARIVFFSELKEYITNK